MSLLLKLEYVTNLSKYERGISIPSLEVAEKIATELNISLDQLVYGDNKAENIIKDNELLSLLIKTQDLTEGQKTTVKDLLEAFIFKTNLKKELSI
ncbi:helix-turn-helix domain-containing protein [Flavobacterium sp. JP2137]|uniref:helix-turn-helix domain-containing protein n=1 Tax=Flavobacterium sp. JP2137 TaxID=3414510 RepID=UPI003D2FEF17